MNLENRILLKEVVVKAQPYERTIYGEPDAVIKVEENMYGYPDVVQLIQARVPGVYVTGYGPTAQIRIRGTATFMGSSTPLILLDGSSILIPLIEFHDRLYKQDFAVLSFLCLILQKCLL